MSVYKCVASVFLSVLVSVSRDLKCIGVYIVLLKSSLIFVFLSASKRYTQLRPPRQVWGAYTSLRPHMLPMPPQYHHWLALRLLTPAFVTSSLLLWRKTSSQVYIWGRAFRPWYSCGKAFWSWKMSLWPYINRSVPPWSVVVIGSALHYLWLFWKCITPPYLRLTSRHVTTCDKWYQPLAMLVLQVTNAGVRRDYY